jgi:hypothetical protein
VLTLHSGLVPDDRSNKLRFSLSLDSCYGCHGVETHGLQINESTAEQYMHFDQIRYREPDAPSTLSRFLTGAEDGQPHLYRTWPVRPPTVKGCGPNAGDRLYNDLVRRTAFHLMVQTLQPSYPDDVWDKTLNAAGLTASQPH